MPRLEIRLSESEFDALKGAAEQLGTSMSELARRQMGFDRALGYSHPLESRVEALERTAAELMELARR